MDLAQTAPAAAVQHTVEELRLGGLQDNEIREILKRVVCHLDATGGSASRSRQKRRTA